MNCWTVVMLASAPGGRVYLFKQLHDGGDTTGLDLDSVTKSRCYDRLRISFGRVRLFNG